MTEDPTEDPTDDGDEADDTSGPHAVPDGRVAPSSGVSTAHAHGPFLGLTSMLLCQVPGVSHRFFDRIGGTSPHPYAALNVSHEVHDAPARVEENLARVRFQLGVRKGALFQATQVHGHAVLDVDEPHGAERNALPDEDDAERLRKVNADGLVTLRDQTGVAVRTADCAPVLFAVDDGSGVAAAHAGWRGAVAGVVEDTLRRLCTRANVHASRVVVAIGPTIGPAAFEVGPEVVAALRATGLSDVSVGVVRPGVGDRAHVNLRAFISARLVEAGVQHIELVGGCTFTDSARYFSHRRDVTLNKQPETGRQLSAIARVTPPELDMELFG